MNTKDFLRFRYRGPCRQNRRMAAMNPAFCQRC